MTTETRIKAIQVIAEDYLQYLIDNGQIKVVYPKQGDEWLLFVKQYDKLS